MGQIPFPDPSKVREVIHLFTPSLFIETPTAACDREREREKARGPRGVGSHLEKQNKTPAFQHVRRCGVKIQRKGLLSAEAFPSGRGIGMEHRGTGEKEAVNKGTEEERTGLLRCPHRNCGARSSRAVANQAVESLEYRQVDSGQTQEAPQGFCVEKRQAGPEGCFRRGFLYQSLFFFF